MKDTLDIVKNIQNIYDSDVAFTVLKDFERVLDDLDLYVYDNWMDGALMSGPRISRHWVTCSFFWPANQMPDPMGGKRLLDYDCKVTYKKDHVIEPRKIIEPDDVRPGTKKGKLDRKPIWVVEIMMPKKIIADIYGGYAEMINATTDPATQQEIASPEVQQAEVSADVGGAEAPAEEGVV